MNTTPVDTNNKTTKAIVRAAAALRRSRMDKPLAQVVRDAREAAEREQWTYLMEEGRTQ